MDVRARPYRLGDLEEASTGIVDVNGPTLFNEEVVRRVGIEPTTYGLRVLKSAIPMMHDGVRRFTIVLIFPANRGNLLCRPTTTVCYGS